MLVSHCLYNVCASVWELEMFFINEEVSSRDFASRKNANINICKYFNFHIVHVCKTRKQMVTDHVYTDAASFHAKVSVNQISSFSNFFFCLTNNITSLQQHIGPISNASLAVTLC